MINNLAKVLQERRKTKKLTLSQVSIITGVSVAHIGRIENGKRLPSAHILRKLAKPLGFSEVELFKLADFLSRDDSDMRLDAIKMEIKRDITHALVGLYKKIDSYSSLTKG